MRPRLLTVIATVLVAVTVLGTGVAYAAWVIAGSGSGATAAASLAKPVLTATQSSTSPESAIDLSWTAGAQPPGTTYEVRRNGTTVVCTSPSPCTDSGLAPGTTYSYVVTAKLGLWTRASDPASATTATVTPATQYTLAATPGSITAGASTSVVITARGAGGVRDTNYTGTKAITWSGNAYAASPGGTAPSAATSVAFTNGVSAPVPVTLTTAGSGLVLAVTGPGGLTGSTTVTVTPAAAARLAMTSTTWNAGSTVTGCTVFACTRSGMGNGGSVTTRVSVADSLGNTVSNLGTAVTVNLSQSGSGTLTGSPLTIPASGAATSTATTTLQEGTGNYTNTLTAASQAPATYTSATTTIKKGS